jgi:hypothetical protein
LRNESRSKEQGTRNKEQGTRSKEQGTRNKEQGTRNKEQGAQREVTLDRQKTVFQHGVAALAGRADASGRSQASITGPRLPEQATSGPDIFLGRIPSKLFDKQCFRRWSCFRTL